MFRFNMLRLVIPPALLLAISGSSAPAAAQAPGLPAVIVETVKADAAAWKGVTPEVVDVLRADAVTWENICMGGVSTGLCSGGPVQGYVVWVAAGSPPEALRYHTNDDGGLVVLSGTGLAPTSVPTAAVPNGATAGWVSFTGELPAPGSIALLVTGGQTTAAALVSALGDAGCSVSVLAIVSEGQWMIHLHGAPAQVNALFPSLLAPMTPFFTRCAQSSPASTAPVQPMTIRLPETDDPPPGLSVGELVAGRLSVFGDGVLCGSFNAAAGVSLAVGTVVQPDACRREAAVLELVDGMGRRLAQSFNFEPGATERLENFAPVPPGSVYPQYICDLLDAEGIERAECQVVGPPAGGRQ